MSNYPSAAILTNSHLQAESHMSRHTSCCLSHLQRWFFFFFHWYYIYSSFCRVACWWSRQCFSHLPNNIYGAHSIPRVFFLWTLPFLPLLDWLETCSIAAKTSRQGSWQSKFERCLVTFPLPLASNRAYDMGILRLSSRTWGRRMKPPLPAVIWFLFLAWITLFGCRTLTLVALTT